MRDGIIYDCPNANCRTPICTGKCSKACIEKYNKEMGIKPKTNADRIRAMSDEELAEDYCRTLVRTMKALGVEPTGSLEDAVRVRLKWLQAPAEGE